MKPEPFELDREPPTTTHPDSSDVVTVAAAMPEINLLTTCFTPLPEHAKRLVHPVRRDSWPLSVVVTGGNEQLRVGGR